MCGDLCSAAEKQPSLLKETTTSTMTVDVPMCTTARSGKKRKKKLRSATIS